MTSRFTGRAQPGSRALGGLSPSPGAVGGDLACSPGRAGVGHLVPGPPRSPRRSRPDTGQRAGVPGVSGPLRASGDGRVLSSRYLLAHRVLPLRARPAGRPPWLGAGPRALADTGPGGFGAATREAEARTPPGAGSRPPGLIISCVGRMALIGNIGSSLHRRLLARATSGLRPCGPASPSLGRGAGPASGGGPALSPGAERDPVRSSSGEAPGAEQDDGSWEAAHPEAICSSRGTPQPGEFRPAAAGRPRGGQPFPRVRALS